jgi:hypothetical protein
VATGDRQHAHNRRVSICQPSAGAIILSSRACSPHPRLLKSPTTTLNVLREGGGAQADLRTTITHTLALSGFNSPAFFSLSSEPSSMFLVKELATHLGLYLTPMASLTHTSRQGHTHVPNGMHLRPLKKCAPSLFQYP